VAKWLKKHCRFSGSNKPKRPAVLSIMKKFIPVLLFILICFATQAQRYRAVSKKAALTFNNTLSKADLQRLKLLEDTLRDFSNEFTDDTLAGRRQAECYAFIPRFVRALKTRNSFYYPFDSLETLYKIYPADSSFRIFTWQVYLIREVKIPAIYSRTGRDTFFEKPFSRYYGVIQMRSSAFKIFPLFDAGDTLAYGTQQVLGPNNWLGEIYYNLIEKSAGGKNYYTLFGYQVVDQLTRRKIIDILTFDARGKPHFGAPLFYFKYNDSTAVKKCDTLSRFSMEYKWDASTVLNYDSDLEMIVFDHVVPPSDAAKGATFTYVPDGTYEGFIWTKNHWQWVEKVFTFAINENDNPPIPSPLFGQPKRQPKLPQEGDPR
jgi:hypothetical protein